MSYKRFIPEKPYDDRNWCRVCGTHYCWHTEAITTPEERSQYGHHEEKHQFKPIGRFRENPNYYLGYSRFWLIRMIQRWLEQRRQ